MRQEKPLIRFKPATKTSRRRWNSVRMCSTDDWSPQIASMPATCVKLAVQEFEFVISRVMCAAKSGRITP